MPSINVVNASFEAENLANGDFTYGGVGSGAIQGWVLAGGSGGVYDPNDSELGNITGSDVGYLYDSGATVSQQLTRVYDSNEEYEFSVDIGDPNYSGPVDYTINIYAGTELIGTKSGTTDGSDTLQTDTVTSDVFDEGLETDDDGNPVRIRIEIVKDGQDNQELHFDNVQVNYNILVPSDGTVTGSIGDDLINVGYTDLDGDTVDGSDGIDDTINAGAGNDTVYGGVGSDTIDGGIGADVIDGGQGADSIIGGDGNDTIYGDSGGPTAVEQTTFNWDAQGIADETSVTGGVIGNTVSGDIQVEMTITQEANFTGASMETTDVLYDYNGLSDTSSFELYGGAAGTNQNAATMTLDFSSNDAAAFEDDVMDVTFGIFDLDESVGQFLDQVIITAFDADGNPVPVVLTAGSSTTISVNNTTGTATAIGGTGGGNNVNSLTGFLEVSVAGPVAKIVIDYNNVDPDFGNHAIRIGDIELTPIQVPDAAANADNIDAGAGADIVYAGEGNDTVTGGTGNDTLFGGEGNDTIEGGADDDSIIGGAGDDRIVFGDGFGVDSVDGSEDVGDADVDTLDASAMTTNATLDLSGADPETGTLTSGANVATFDNIEAFTLGSGDDSVIGSDGDDSVTAGAGADIISMGEGNDTVDLGAGSPDGEADVVVLQDGFGDDIVTNFDAPTPVGDGTFTGVDTLDVSGLYDLPLGDPDRTPILTNDVTVTDDGFGNALLTFPNGETIVLDGISSIDTDNPFYLNAIGIPMPDGTVSGTAGDDLIDGSYMGDPDGDLVDNDDAIIPGHSVNDDLIEAGAGNDTILSADGNDTIFAGSGNDIIDGGAGNDEMDGGLGSDTFIISDGFGTDTITAGEDTVNYDVDVIDAGTMTADTTLNFTGPEAGTLSDGTNTSTFSEVELFALGSGDDTVIGGAGNELVYAGAGNDTMTGGMGADTFYGGSGNDDIAFSEGDNISGGSGDDIFTLEDLGEPTNGTITIDGGDGGETTDDGNPLTLEGDTLQLGTLADLSTLVKVSDGLNVDGNETFDGSVTMDDGTILKFRNIENIICFTPGTRIATPHGGRDIATLRTGDLVVTRDHGLQQIRWIEQRTVPAIDRFAPIRIRPGVVTGQQRDLLVSPQHRIMFQGYSAELMFGESEVLVAAKYLVDDKHVTRDIGGDVTYIHMMFDEHEVVYAEGAATESFHPGDVGLTAISDPAREELFSLFPSLRTNPNGYGQTARRCLKKYESELLVRYPNQGNDRSAWDAGARFGFEIPEYRS
jgi:Ca2+-binding RTX toxin-like protein